MRGELGRITECVRSGCHGFRTVSECLWLILRKSVVLSSVWQCYGVCEDYNGIVSKVLGDGWLNPRILSIQSLKAHHRSQC